MNESTDENAAKTIEFPAEFTVEQKTVMEALLAGLNPAAAARAAGVHRSTVSRWISQGGAFHRMLREEQAKQLRETKREALSMAAAAAKRGREGDPRWGRSGGDRGAPRPGCLLGVNLFSVGSAVSPFSVVVLCRGDDQRRLSG
jgi:transposase-like protein